MVCVMKVHTETVINILTTANQISTAQHESLWRDRRTRMTMMIVCVPGTCLMSYRWISPKMCLFEVPVCEVSQSGLADSCNKRVI